jgi:predicted DNA-binding protein
MAKAVYTNPYLIRMTPEMATALEYVASSLDVDRSDFIREAIQDKLDDFFSADARRKNEGNNGHAAVETA